MKHRLRELLMALPGHLLSTHVFCTKKGAPYSNVTKAFKKAGIA